jgi:transposase
MARRTHPPYPAEFRRRLVELVRGGRSPESLAREFEPSAPAIRNWCRQSELEEGPEFQRLTGAEREELQRLRRETRKLR